jgi:hypothetical protein
MQTIDAIDAAFGANPFSLADARAAGITRSAVRNAHAGGRLHRLGHDLYVREPEAGYRTQVVVAARTHADAVLILDAAAHLHGFWCPWPSGWRAPTVAVARGRRRQYALARVVQRAYDPEDIAQVDGLTVTSPARTALDLAAQLTLPEALVVVDAYARRGSPARRTAVRPELRSARRDELLRACVRMTAQRGIDRARQAAALADPAAESAPESYARGLCLVAGHPEPLVQHPVRGADGRTYYADLYWPGCRLIVEIDGAEKYDERSGIVDEKRREDTLRAAGFRFRRIIAGDLWRTGIEHERQAA